MTFKTAPTVFVVCDSANHPGDIVHRVEFGPVHSANEALRQLGWHYKSLLNKHFCPDCARVQRLSN